MNGVFELAKYVYGNYSRIKEMFPFWRILSLIDRNQDKVICIKDGENFIGAAMYLKLTDETLEQLMMGQIDLSSPIDMRIILREQGNNIHFIYATANKIGTILKGLRQVIEKENPHSVSWFKPDMSLHFIKLRGVELCHHLQSL